MNKSDSPRLTNKLYEILKDVINNKNSLEKFTQEFLDNLQLEEESYYQSLNVVISDTKLYYQGYPSGNYLKILCKVLEIWHNCGSFPINFYQIDGLRDQTSNIVEFLNGQTSMLNEIFNYIKDNNVQSAFRQAVIFLESIEIRGFLTILGVRLTSGSCDNYLPQKAELFGTFNAIYKKREASYSKDDDCAFEIKKYSTKITVGGRALSKHYDRNKDSFWGLCVGSEEERNNHANDVFKRIMEECAWINIHYLSHSKQIIEVRNIRGYGMRWNLNGQFRGLIEPEDLKDHKNKDDPAYC